MMKKPFPSLHMQPAKNASSALSTGLTNDMLFSAVLKLQSRLCRELDIELDPINT